MGCNHIDYNDIGHSKTITVKTENHIDHMENPHRPQTNNVKVNPTKYDKIVFSDKRQKTVKHTAEPMPNTNSLKHEIYSANIYQQTVLFQNIFRLSSVHVHKLCMR